jgi:activator of HSP90 ATPase
MADASTADPRWRVQDMGEQGRNVNAWHWTNHDASAWSKTRLGELFAASTAPLAADAAGPVAADNLRSFKGDVELMNRKGRLIVTYELELSIGWKSGDDLSGIIEIPYFGDEHEGDEEPPAMRVSVEGGSGTPAGDAARAALLKPEAKQEVAKRLRQLVAELRQGAPLHKGEKEGLAADAAATEATAEATAALPPVATAKPAVAAPKPAAATKPSNNTATDTDSLELEQRFHARASDLFECFTVEPKLKAWQRGSDARVPTAGDGFLGPFSWFGGSVQGRVTKVEVDKRLEMDWRFSSWEEGCASRVVLEFGGEEGEDGDALAVRLRQTGIPHEDAHGNLDQLALVTQGWKERVFGRIRQTFGYGTGGF